MDELGYSRKTKKINGKLFNLSPGISTNVIAAIDKLSVTEKKRMVKDYGVFRYLCLGSIPGESEKTKFFINSPQSTSHSLTN